MVWYLDLKFHNYVLCTVFNTGTILQNYPPVLHKMTRKVIQSRCRFLFLTRHPLSSSGHSGCPPGSGYLRCTERSQRHQPYGQNIFPNVFVCVAVSHQLHHLSHVSEPTGSPIIVVEFLILYILFYYHLGLFIYKYIYFLLYVFQIDADKDVNLNIYMEGRGFAMVQVISVFLVHLLYSAEPIYAQRNSRTAGM